MVSSQPAEDLKRKDKTVGVEAEKLQRENLSVERDFMGLKPMHVKNPMKINQLILKIAPKNDRIK